MKIFGGMLFFCLFFSFACADSPLSVDSFCYSPDSSQYFWLNLEGEISVEFLNVNQDFIDRRVFFRDFYSPDIMCLWENSLFIYDQSHIIEINLKGDINSVFFCPVPCFQVTFFVTFDGKKFYFVGENRSEFFVWEQGQGDFFQRYFKGEVRGLSGILEWGDKVLLTSFSQGLTLISSRDVKKSKKRSCLQFISGSFDLGCFFVGEHQIFDSCSQLTQVENLFSKLLGCLKRFWETPRQVTCSLKYLKKFRIRRYCEYFYEYQVSPWMQGVLKGVVWLSGKECLVVYEFEERYVINKLSSINWERVCESSSF